MIAPEKDLFGQPMPAPAMIRKDGGRRKVGYAARPGSGPKGHRCATCRHAERVTSKGVASIKCALMAHAWTHGAETDISLRAPACRQWERKVFQGSAT